MGATDSTQAGTKNYREQGGSVDVIGGELLIATGGKISANGTQAGPTTALTDSTGGGGAAGGTLAADCATQLLMIPVPALSALTNGQNLNIDPGFNGKITAVNFRVGASPASTANKAATVTATANSVAVTGGVASLTTAACNTAGAQVAGTAITGANTFTSAQPIGVAISGVTAFVEGGGVIELTVVNTDLLAALSTLAVQSNALLTILQGIGASS